MNSTRKESPRMSYHNVACSYYSCLLFFLAFSQCLLNPASAQEQPPLVFATFNQGDENDLGGRHGTFFRAPSLASFVYNGATIRGASGRSLAVDATKSAEGGFCGLWMHVHDTGASPTEMFDASEYSHFSFWVRGNVGGERFQILLTDPDSPDGVLYGDVQDFLAGPVTANAWQEVIVPLQPAPFGLDLTQLFGVTLLFNTAGSHYVYLDDFSFKTSANQVVPETGPPDNGPEVFIMDTFDEGNRNPLGGHFNKFDRSPSSAKVTKSFVEFRGEGGKSLEVIAEKDATQGWCGIFIHFFDNFDANPEYVDATTFSFLSFWVKGENGGESFRVRMADQRYIDLEDSLLVGPVTDFLSSGTITTEWQQVLIPLASAPSLDMAVFGGLTLDFDVAGTHVVFIDDVALTSSVAAVIPTTPADPPGEAPTIPSRSMWMWEMESIYVDDPAPREELFQICELHNIKRLWTYLHIEPFFPHYLTVPSPGFTSTIASDEVQIRAFNREAHARGIEVHALTGSPELVQKRFHHVTLGWVDLVLDFNNRVAQEDERFDGVRLDNEPHVMPLWHHTQRRPEILQEFLELNEEVQRRCTEADLVFGIDIPTWWNQTDEVTNQPFGLVTYKGETKSADLFCIDLFDNVGLLNYRDAVYGLDSMLAAGIPLLEYAESVGRQNIVMGVETYLRPPAQIWFAPGLTYEEFESVMSGKALDDSYFSKFDGFATRVVKDGSRIHIGLEVPADLDIWTHAFLRKAFRRLSNLVGVGSYSVTKYRGIVQGVIDAACNAIERSPEYINGCDKQSLGKRYPLLLTTNIMLPKISFADESYDFFVTEVAKAESEFVDYPGYAGEAIHFYTTLKEKYLDKSE